VRLLALIEYAAVIIGIIGMVAGKFFAIHKGFEFGVFMAGLGIALGGLEGVLTYRMPFRTSDEAYEPHAGAPAIIVGLMALLIGAAIIGAAYLLADGLWNTAVNYLTRRPALVLAAAGLLLIGVGVLMMMNPTGRRGFFWTLLIYIPRSLAGFILVAAGLGAIASGAWEWYDPRAFHDFVRKLPNPSDVMRAVRRL
jgi:hypothetical protein